MRWYKLDSSHSVIFRDHALLDLRLICIVVSYHILKINSMYNNTEKENTISIFDSEIRTQNEIQSMTGIKYILMGFEIDRFFIHRWYLKWH